MGLFGSKEKPEDLMYNGMSLMEKNQPKGAISLFNKVLKQNEKMTEYLKLISFCYFLFVYFYLIQIYVYTYKII